eukprot:COSAG01_NODE_152_length_23937_cov_122.193976_20_plen_431_part_00
MAHAHGDHAGVLHGRAAAAVPRGSHQRGRAPTLRLRGEGGRRGKHLCRRGGAGWGGGENKNETEIETKKEAVAKIFQPGLITFSTAEVFSEPWENLICVFIGLVGGVMGAAFIRIHVWMARVRKRVYRGLRWRKVMEVVCVSVVTSLTLFLLAYAGHCQPLNEPAGTNVVVAKYFCDSTPHVGKPRQNCPNGLPCPLGGSGKGPSWISSKCYEMQSQQGLPHEPRHCPCPVRGTPPPPPPQTNCTDADSTYTTRFGHTCNDTHYNDLATLLFSPREEVIKSIMERPERYTKKSLFLCGLAFFVCLLVRGRFRLSCACRAVLTEICLCDACSCHEITGWKRPRQLAHGIACPAGVFIPTIMIGACWGGAFGLCFTDWVHQLHGSKIIKPAPYALMGAVAMLGGVQRSSISLVVIILEGTGAVSTTPSPPAH